MIAATAAMLTMLSTAPATSAHDPATAAAFADGRLGQAETALPSIAADDTLRCRLLLFANHTNKAADCFDARIAAGDRDPKTTAGLALAAFHSGQFARAAAAYERAGKPIRAAEMRLLAQAPSYQVATAKRTHHVDFVITDPLPVVKVGLGDGREHLFILDTGAAETVLDPAVAEQAHVATLQGALMGTFAGGRQAQVRYGLLPTLKLGDLTMSRVPVAIQPTQAFAAAVGQPSIDGVIGVDLLRHFIATIDYPSGRLTLRPLDGASARGMTTNFWIGEDHLLLSQAAIDGLQTLALVDTGLAGQGCTMPQSTFERIQAKATGQVVQGVGGGGQVSAQAFSAGSISIGRARRTDLPCLIGPFPPALETSTGAHVGLLISHAFLRPYAVTFDFGRMMMTLARADPKSGRRRNKA